MRTFVAIFEAGKAAKLSMNKYVYQAYALYLINCLLNTAPTHACQWRRQDFMRGGARK